VTYPYKDVLNLSKLTSGHAGYEGGVSDDFAHEYEDRIDKKRLLNPFVKY